MAPRSHCHWGNGFPTLMSWLCYTSSTGKHVHAFYFDLSYKFWFSCHVAPVKCACVYICFIQYVQVKETVAEFKTFQKCAKGVPTNGIIKGGFLNEITWSGRQINRVPSIQGVWTWSSLAAWFFVHSQTVKKIISHFSLASFFSFDMSFI